MLDVLRVRAMSEQDREAAKIQIVSAYLWYLRTPLFGPSPRTRIRL